MTRETPATDPQAALISRSADLVLEWLEDEVGVSGVVAPEDAESLVKRIVALCNAHAHQQVKWAATVIDQENAAQAAAHAEDVRKIQTTIVVKDDLIARMRNLLVDAIYLMRHFREDDAAYRGWQEMVKAIVAEIASPPSAKGERA